MAEYKQYISQAQENGNVLISEDVVEAIAEHALAEVECRRSQCEAWQRGCGLYRREKLGQGPEDLHF